MYLSPARDLLRFEQAADPRDVRLDDVDAFVFDQVPEVEAAERAFAGRDGHWGAGAKLTHPLVVVGRNWLFEETDSILLQGSSDATSHRRGEARMSVDVYLDVGAGGFSNGGDELGGLADISLRGKHSGGAE